MDARDLANEKAASQRGRRPWYRNVGAAATVALAGALAAGALAAPVAGAATAHAKAKGKPKATANVYASVEKQLSGLEKPPSGVSLLETGSTLLYPLISAWAAHYPATHVTTAGTGSGTGIADALNGTVQLGASDAYLPISDPSNLLDIPLDVSAQQVDYNLPGVKGHLKLNAAVLNGMYNGTITKWNDPAIAALNKGVSLPATTVVPLHRSDGSGDTFMFTSFLDFQDPSSWVASSGGPNTSIHFPSVPTALAEQGNGGMLAGCEKTTGCVAYIGISYLRSALKAGLGDAQLENGSGKYVLPTPGAISSEVASFQHIPSTGAISLVNSKNAKFGYPIVNFEYAIVNANQSSSTTAQAIRAFLAWGMDPRNGSSSTYLTPIYFHPLAPGAMQIALNLLKKIQ
ncbi:MAG TPA: phosphate ABC transporter substrate-binding protein PstS [Acidimicrobiales bacterium]|nr:phosphate ABC transporter substrate-binding protein PstS [Acidimicrobiales bacterium]